MAQRDEELRGRVRWGCRCWLGWVTIVVVGCAGVHRSANSDPVTEEDGAQGPDAGEEPQLREDGGVSLDATGGCPEGQCADAAAADGSVPENAGSPDARVTCADTLGEAAADEDGDHRGDACDNCPTLANYDQADRNHDEMGDACDPDLVGPRADSDGDGLRNEDDRCPSLASSDNTDSDRDGWGDACDNCKRVANARQIIALSAMDLAKCNEGTPPDPNADDDGDGVINGEDKCPDTRSSEPYTAAQQRNDADHDGIGDGCDTCPTTANVTQNPAGCMVANVCGVDAPVSDCPPSPSLPVAPEVCDDGVDNDADGQIDEWCPQPCPMIGNEVCDGADNDCDDAVDEGCPAH